ncbi:VOC family protein [Colwellia sp. M166]|uniref:VOC family protein n=1 Tax=Colwellia sp. M166 TaxID=2583805 RepID=UPI00211F42EF|nr:VOC family protein [Colwellia sp. M166]UUO24826.1 VOC family protein [Colwellia sp. M166]|tara:strand:- start:18705 stop:19091 length:387 start_codon:yes stop_codon:yes gene_type:complete
MHDNKIATMAWLDLSVENAETVKSFYQQVIGWKADNISMGDYDDYAMLEPSGNEAVAGVCHAKGINKDLPPAWLPYFLVADIMVSIKPVEESGGSLVSALKSMGNDKYALIKDPAGAVCAIYQKMSIE